MSHAPTGDLLLLASLLAATGCAHQGAPQPAPGGEEMPRVTVQGERGTVPGDPELFTGDATIRFLFRPQGPRDFSGAWVTFEPGARTAWHTHPAGQTLVVTEGTGWVQLEGEERLEVQPGDVVWTPPGIRHWHGATASASMTHMALQGAVDGTVVDWGEHVDDDQYLQADR